MPEAQNGTARLAEPVRAPEGAELLAVLAEQYAEVVDLIPLPGEVDRNYRVNTADGARMLKISRPGPNASMQTAIAEHLDQVREPVAVPALVRGRRGESVVPVELGGEQVLLRMTTFLHGVSPRATTLTPGFYGAFGRDLARLDLALRSLDTGVTQDDHPWHIAHAPSLSDRLQRAEAFVGRDQWIAELAQCAEDVLPALERLPAQVIHNDLNPENVLVTADGSEVVGVVDFGDAVTAPRILDVAIAAAYFVEADSPRDLLATLASIVRGYHATSPLTRDEIDLVGPLLRARWAMALGMNWLRAAEHPDDAAYVAYVRRNSPRSARRLEVFSGIDPASVTALLRECIS